MAQSSRPVLQVRNIPTGVAKFDEDPPLFIEREFGIDPDDPASAHIVRHICHLKVSYGIDIREHPELLPNVVAAGRRSHEREMAVANYPEPADEPVVYYVRVGHLIKLGTTLNLHTRLRAYPPGAVVLATEPGGYDVERERHQQFREALAERKEWFRPTVELIEHINGLREQPLTAADLAA